LDLFRKIHRQNQSYQDLDNYYDVRVLDNFIQMPTYWLLKNKGIGVGTQERFGICFDRRSQRVLYPYFDSENNNVINGIMGRTTVPNFNELGICKYLPVYKVAKHNTLYGLLQNRRGINATGKVIIVEAENSVLRAYQMKYDNVVAIGHHELLKGHVKKLFGLNINEVIIALDKDISVEFIKEKIYPLLSPYYTVSYICDEWDLLGEKDSPFDGSYKVFNFLYKHRIEISQ